MKKILLNAFVAIPIALTIFITMTPHSFAADVAIIDDVQAASSIQNKRDALSYAVGVNTARSLSKEGRDVNIEMVLKGMSDALYGNRTLMSEKEMRSAMNGLFVDMRMKMRATRRDAAEANKKSGEDFRASFAKQDGVIALPNGVLYKIVKQGDGQKPSMNDTVQTNYRGTLISGYEFDATPVGKSASVKVESMIKGLGEATRMMPTGSRWTIVVPPQLAYGNRGVGGDIGPEETLIFDQEIISIVK